MSEHTHAGMGSSPLTTKGDLYGYDSADARLPVGTDGDYLIADSTQSIGVKWAASESFFPIWAEENSTLGASNTYEWAFGNGSNTQNNEGVIMYVPSGYECHTVAMSAQVDGTSPSATIELVLNGTPQGAACHVVLTATNTGVDELGTPLAISSGDRINFRTTSASGTATSSRVTAWFRLRRT